MTNRGILVMLWPFYPKTWMHRVRALEEKNLQKEEIWDVVVVEATEKKEEKEKKRPEAGRESHFIRKNA